jgi:hypothetical protein
MTAGTSVSGASATARAPADLYARNGSVNKKWNTR